MIIDKKGDIFTSEAEALGHGVNIEGLMGAGIAKEIRRRYPAVYAVYRKACKKGLLTPGSTLPVKDPRTGTVIMNIASQDSPGPYARNEWLAEGVEEALRYAKENGIKSLALPKIGCGIGRLEWSEVKEIITEISSRYPEVDVELWVE